MPIVLLVLMIIAAHQPLWAEDNPEGSEVYSEALPAAAEPQPTNLPEQAAEVAKESMETPANEPDVIAEEPAQELTIGAHVQLFTAKDDRNEQTVTTNILQFSPIFNFRFDDDTAFAGKINFASGGPEAHAGGSPQVGSATVEYAHVTHQLSAEEVNFLQLRVGHQLIQIGLTNADPNPLNRYTVLAPELESALIPNDWHENGLLLLGRYQYFDYSLGVFNSIDANRFSAAGTSRNYLIDGVQKGQQAISDHVMGTLRIDYNFMEQNIGASLIYGKGGQNSGSIEKSQMTLWDVHSQFRYKHLSFKGVFAHGAYNDASLVSGPTFFEQAQGYYSTLAFDVLGHFNNKTSKSLPLFIRHSEYNLNEKVPLASTPDPALQRTRTTIGINFKPRPQVIYKAHYTMKKNAESEEEDLVQVGASVVF